MKRFQIVIVFAILWAAITQIHADGGGDTLLYVAFDHYQTAAIYVIYNPIDGTHTPAHIVDRFVNFSYSIDGNLALACDTFNIDNCIVDAPVGRQTTAIIGHNAVSPSYPPLWSPDGRFLAYISDTEDSSSKRLYIWDGNAEIDITPGEPVGAIKHYRMSWSLDGRLAFMPWYETESHNDSSQIYLWTGEGTVRLVETSVSYTDQHFVWSGDGQLAFWSGTETGRVLLIWDGTSFIDGIPDSNHFIDVTPDLNWQWFDPVWTSDGLLALSGTTPSQLKIQVFTLDEQPATNISQNPDLHNAGARWSEDGHWAFVTFFSSKQLLYIRDAENNTVLEIEGQYAPAWSADNQLAFCAQNEQGWTLSVWDGQRVTEIARGREIQAQWQSGATIACSSG